MAAFKNYEEKTTELCMPLIEEMGLILWDVEFLKEGAEHYLRIYIDKEGGVGIDECEALSRRMNEILDREDFIDQEYIFEVSSPGLFRPLKREYDFKHSVGRMVEAHTFAPKDGQKEFFGTLTAYSDDDITISIDGTDTVFTKKELSLIRLYTEI